MFKVDLVNLWACLKFIPPPFKTLFISSKHNSEDLMCTSLSLFVGYFVFTNQALFFFLKHNLLISVNPHNCPTKYACCPLTGTWKQSGP